MSDRFSFSASVSESSWQGTVTVIYSLPPFIFPFFNKEEKRWESAGSLVSEEHRLVLMPKGHLPKHLAAEIATSGIS